MFVRRYFLLVMVLLQATVVAESRAGENFFSPYYSESDASSSFFSPGAWVPDSAAFNMSERFRNQREKNEPRTTNPWSLPARQWAPTIPQYIEPAFRSNDYSTLPQYMEQTGKQNTVTQDYPSRGYRSSGQSNPPVSSKRPYAESVWYSQPSLPAVVPPPATMSPFQQAPRFVTPDVLDALNRQQMQAQRVFPFNHHQKSSQEKRRWTASPNHTQQTYQQAYKPGANSDYRYSSRSLEPYSVTDSQLNNERLLYMGDSLPTVPDAAISGLPPMNIFEPLPPILSGAGNNIGWGANRFGIGPYGDFLQP